MAGSHFNIWQFLNPRLARRSQVWLVRGVFYKAAGLSVDLSISMNCGKSAQEAAT
jgi:hypothetical protein